MEKHVSAERVNCVLNCVQCVLNISMRAVLLTVAVLFTTGCNISLTQMFGSRGIEPPPQLTVAEQYVGLHERRDRVTLREFMGIDPLQVEWCAAFVNSVLSESGAEPTGSLMARSYLSWGASTLTPTPGDVMVFSRGAEGWQGHVGFYVATVDYKDSQYWIVLGGNQDNTVSYQLFPVGHWRHLDTRTIKDPEEKQLLIDRQWMWDGIPLELILE